MGSTFYLFYMVLFTGGVLWCLFLWLVRDDEEERGEEGEAEGPPSRGPEAPSPAASVFSVKASADDSPRPPPSP